MVPWQALTVVEETTVSEAIDAAVASHKLIDEVFEAAKWRLAHEPECGELLPADVKPPRRILLVPPNSIARSPGLLVRYYIQSDQVVIDWVKIYPYDDRQANAPAPFVLQGE